MLSGVEQLPPHARPQRHQCSADVCRQRARPGVAASYNAGLPSLCTSNKSQVNSCSYKALSQHDAILLHLAPRSRCRAEMEAHVSVIASPTAEPVPQPPFTGAASDGEQGELSDGDWIDPETLLGSSLLVRALWGSTSTLAHGSGAGVPETSSA